VTLSLALDGAQVTLTLPTGNALLVRKGDDVVLSLLAEGTIQKGDFVRTHRGDAEVLAVSEFVHPEMKIFEVAFAGPNDCAFVSVGKCELAVQVFGKVSFRPPPYSAKLLAFKRCDDFANLFLKGEDFAACRKTLEDGGLSMDLSDDRLKLGHGKLVVDDLDLANEVVEYLRTKRVQENVVEINGTKLNKACVIVSGELEPRVRSLVKASTREKSPDKKNPVKNEPGYFLCINTHPQAGSRKRQSVHPILQGNEPQPDHAKVPRSSPTSRR
jgi:hypothetical protein